ncbi:hypothetical protein OOT00_06320 [Desulfobotulus sp. H1]|uniref:Tetratricopeptide repeat protein n=1 Tax=Desulfobotulus pelophilus TaxID=2823377 RepID=A0ABT3N818_9BACT|nr:hypothetical protein [Desulfobotulus pelophilus]MCW7753603.1 hypothetical protein [Desulfobotulus pelophilus]
MRLRTLLLSFSSLVLLWGCTHSSFYEKETRVYRLSLDNLYPLPADYTMHPDDLPGNNNRARAALFHTSGASPASFVWQVMNRFPNPEQHPHYHEILARILLMREEMDAALHVADTRLEKKNRFFVYRLAYCHLMGLGLEKEASILLQRLDASFPKNERKTLPVQLLWLEFHHSEKNYEEMQKTFQSIENYLRKKTPLPEETLRTFYTLRIAAGMAIDRQDVMTAERIAIIMEKLIPLIRNSTGQSGSQEEEDLGHTYFITRQDWWQPETHRSIATVHLLRIYGEIGNREKVSQLYTVLMADWQQALRASKSGNSFEIWLPSVGESLFSSGLHEEAMNLRHQIPTVLPFIIHPDPSMEPESLAILQADLQRHNFRAPPLIQKDLAIRLASAMGPVKNEEAIVAWIASCDPPTLHRTLATRALASRLEAGLQAPLLTQHLAGLRQSSQGKKILLPETRRLATALIQSGQYEKARSFAEEEIARIHHHLSGHEAAECLASLAQAFSESLPSLAESLFSMAMDSFEDITPSHRSATIIHRIAILSRSLNAGSLHRRILTEHERVHRFLMNNTDPTLYGDRLIEEKLQFLFKISRIYYHFGIRDDRARGILAECAVLADQFHDPLIAEQMAFRTAEAWGYMGWFHEAYQALEGITITEAKFPKALLRIRQGVLTYDAFPALAAARFDTDGDGRPDFFSVLATQEVIDATGLLLDPDSDGDGIPDVSDTRPWFPDR